MSVLCVPQTVLDTNYTADIYKGEILKELSEDRSKLRHETFLKAQKDKVCASQSIIGGPGPRQCLLVGVLKYAIFSMISACSTVFFLIVCVRCDFV